METWLEMGHVFYCCCLYDSLCDSFQEDTQWLMLCRIYPSVVPFLFKSDESM